MTDESLEFLQALVQTPSPSGYEQPVQKLVRSWASRYADEVRTDRHGNVIAVKQPGQEPRVMLAGHCDQIGLMVQYIDDNGFLYVQPIGGWDMQILLGQRLTVWTESGSLAGVVARRATHLLAAEERNKPPQFTDIWVDIGARNREEAAKLVRIGDPVTIELGMRRLQNDNVAAPGLDDKAGVWVVFETLRRLVGCPLRCSLYVVSTVQEEIGLRGAVTSAHAVHPHVGIAVDVTHATDTPNSSDKKQLGDIGLGKGPVLVRGPNVHPRVYERLVRAAESRRLGYQVEGCPRGTGTDANAIQLSREGVATGLIGLPNRYMHAPVETVNLRDLDAAAELLAAFCTDLSPDVDWTP
ncbi:MAG: hydrolase [Gemmataceae bacterium]